MTCLFMDSFDDRDTAHRGNRYTAIGANSTIVNDGRNGNCLHTLSGNDGPTRSLGANEDVVIVGFAIYIDALPSVGIYAYLYDFLDSGTVQVRFKISSDGHIIAYRGTGTTVLGTSTLVLSEDTWHYVELKVTFSQTVGTLDVHIDESSAMAEVGKDTCSSVNEWCNAVTLGSSISAKFDDYYICNNAGAVNNDFVGDCKIECLFPTANGATQDWPISPNTGEVAYQDVDDTVPDDDATFIYDDAVYLPDISTFVMSDLSTTSGIVKATQVNIIARKDDSAVVTCNATIRQGGSDYHGASVNLSSSYENKLTIFEEDPDTGAQWVIAGVNTAEVGGRRTA